MWGSASPVVVWLQKWGYVYVMRNVIIYNCPYLFFFKANSEEFIPVFANNPRELKAFLEHMIEVDALSPQGVYDTLLELRLQDWAHEQDPEVSTKHIK